MFYLSFNSYSIKIDFSLIEVDDQIISQDAAVKYSSSLATFNVKSLHCTDHFIMFSFGTMNICAYLEVFVEYDMVLSIYYRMVRDNKHNAESCLEKKMVSLPFPTHGV